MSAEGPNANGSAQDADHGARKNWWCCLKERLGAARRRSAPNLPSPRPPAPRRAHRTTAFFELP